MSNEELLQSDTSLKLEDLDQMDSLVQRCHDLEVRIKRTEEERDVVIMENEDLFSHISSLASRIEYQEGRINPFENEIGLISEEISRLDLSFKSIHGALGNMSEKLKEINNIRESVQLALEETKEVKDDVSQLKITLKAARNDAITDQGELSLSARLQQMEAIMTNFNDQKAGLCYILEETKLLKDQVDLLKESSHVCNQEGHFLPSLSTSELGTDLEEEIQGAGSSPIGLTGVQESEQEADLVTENGRPASETRASVTPLDEKHSALGLNNNNTSTPTCFELFHQVISLFL